MDGETLAAIEQGGVEAFLEGLRRELLEELSVNAEVGPEVYRTEHRYPDGFAVRLLFFRILRYAGAPENHAFERIAWARWEELAGYDFLEADRELVERMARGEINQNP